MLKWVKKLRGYYFSEEDGQAANDYTEACSISLVTRKKNSF